MQELIFIGPNEKGTVQITSHIFKRPAGHKSSFIPAAGRPVINAFYFMVKKTIAGGTTAPTVILWVDRKSQPGTADQHSFGAKSGSPPRRRFYGSAEHWNTGRRCTDQKRLPGTILKCETRPAENPDR
jgi:hypothetical protein